MIPHFTQQSAGTVYEIGSGSGNVVVVTHALAPMKEWLLSEPNFDSAALNTAVQEHAVCPGVGIPSDS